MYQFTDKDIEDARHMRVLLDKGTNFFNSFFTMLSNKRKEIGDAAMSDYCFYHLRVSLSIVMKISACLEEADAIRVREELTRAAEFNRIKKAEEKRAAEDRKHAERMEDQRRKEAQERELREAAERTKAEVQARKKIENETANISAGRPARASRSRGSRKSGGNKPENTNPVTTKTSEVQIDPTIAPVLEIYLNFKKKITMLRDEWKQACETLAKQMHKGRYKENGELKPDQEFGKWLDAHQLRKINKDERAILIDMGTDWEAASKLFDDHPECMSLRGLWRFRNAAKPEIIEQDQGITEVSQNLSVDTQPVGHA